MTYFRFPANFNSHVKGDTKFTRILGIPGRYRGIPKTRQPYWKGILISLGIWVWGYPKHGDTQITVTRPKSHWVGSAWAVARRFVPLANRRAKKTIAIVFQIRLQLVRAKSSFQSPNRTYFEFIIVTFIRCTTTFHIWKSVVQCSYELGTITWKR